MKPNPTSLTSEDTEQIPSESEIGKMHAQSWPKSDLPDMTPPIFLDSKGDSVPPLFPSLEGVTCVTSELPFADNSCVTSLDGFVGTMHFKGHDIAGFPQYYFRFTDSAGNSCGRNVTCPHHYEKYTPSPAGPVKVLGGEAPVDDISCPSCGVVLAEFQDSCDACGSPAHTASKDDLSILLFQISEISDANLRCMRREHAVPLLTEIRDKARKLQGSHAAHLAKIQALETALREIADGHGEEDSWRDYAKRLEDVARAALALPSPLEAPTES